MSSQKIVNLISLKHLVARWKVKSNRIVFTNGCFDILHVGHIHTLKEALKLGDKLIVGVRTHRHTQSAASLTSIYLNMILYLIAVTSLPDVTTHKSHRT